MSDLQCPATIVLLTPETAARHDLRELRLSLVLFGAAEAAADSVARAHRCQLRAAEIADAAALRARIDELADLYRGEQVAIVAAAEVVCKALNRRPPLQQPIKLAVDSDGWNELT